MIKTFKILLFCITLFFSSIACAQQVGNASYYSMNLIGHHTTDGGKYHPDSLTCAHRSFPFGTILKIRNPKNDKEVIVKVTDRGPHQRRLMIDLSFEAAKQLDIIRAGISKVEIIKLDPVYLSRKLLVPIVASLSEIKLSENFLSSRILAF
jgi:rare lipoprotein A